MAVWNISPRFGTFLPVLVCCVKKNLATLIIDGKLFARDFCHKNALRVRLHHCREHLRRSFNAISHNYDSNWKKNVFVG
jgi:hypothetical protein